jgi:hypothetical protein
MNATESFCNAPENRGNPLDAISGEADPSWTANCARECGTSESTVADVVEWYQENVPQSKIDETQLDAAREVLARNRDAFHYLIEYQSNQKKAKEIRMSTRVMALELGYCTAAGANNVAELAQKMRFKKQTVNKCSIAFQPRLKLPPRPGQRTGEQRKHFSDVANERIKTKQQTNYEQ